MRIAAIFVIVGLGVAGCAGPANKLADAVQYPTVCRVADTARCAEELARAQQQWADTADQSSSPAAGPRKDPPTQDQSAGQPPLWAVAPQTVPAMNGRGLSPLQEAVAAPLPSAPVFPRFNPTPLPADSRNTPFGQRAIDMRPMGPR